MASPKDLSKLNTEFALEGEAIIRLSSGSEVTGTQHSSGYKLVKTSLGTMKMSRLKFYLKHGYLPRIVDHANRNKMDDSLGNLRAATKSQNTMNSKKYKPSGLPKGVFKNGPHGFRAEVTASGITHHLGTFPTVEEASSAAHEGRSKYHGDFKLD